jgi:predicted Co/Zn/Cd cation transporter (cation efflux family)
MKTINKIEQEINQIRLKIYEEIKDMTPEELLKHQQKKADETAQKYGFKMVYSVSQILN